MFNNKSKKKMKNVSKKLQALINRMYKLQEELDDIKSGIEDKIYQLEDEEDVNEEKIEKLNDDIDYIDDVYYALDSAISEIENYVEE